MFGMGKKGSIKNQAWILNHIKHESPLRLLVLVKYEICYGGQANRYHCWLMFILLSILLFSMPIPSKLDVISCVSSVKQRSLLDCVSSNAYCIAIEYWNGNGPFRQLCIIEFANVTTQWKVGKHYTTIYMQIQWHIHNL